MKSSDTRGYPFSTYATAGLTSVSGIRLLQYVGEPRRAPIDIEPVRRLAAGGGTQRRTERRPRGGGGGGGRPGAPLAGGGDPARRTRAERARDPPAVGRHPGAG